jgi:hypothetical protein
MTTFKTLTKSLFLLIVVCVLSANAVHAQTGSVPQKAGEPAILDTTKYSVMIPAGWRHYNKTTGDFSALYIAAPRVDSFSSNINIIMVETGNISIDEFLNGNIESMKKGNMAPDSTGDLETNGLKAKFYTTKIDHNGTSIAIKSYFILKGGIGYVLTGACLTSQRTAYYPQFEAIVKSFKIK